MEWRSEPGRNGSIVAWFGVAKRNRKKVEEIACVPFSLLLHSSSMSEEFRYRSRSLTAEDIAGLRGLIAQNPKASRWRLSKLVCEAWGWRQSNGAMCDMLCRSMMLALQRAGHITLPEKKRDLSATVQGGLFRLDWLNCWLIPGGVRAVHEDSMPAAAA